MARKRNIYVRLDEELVEEIDRLRRTEHGEIDRSEYIENIIRQYLGREVARVE